jgi:hypothetical protein
MVFAALAARAATALVQAMGTDDWDGVRDEVARLFGRGRPNRPIERRLADTRHQLASASSPVDAERVKAEVTGQWLTRFADLLAEHPEAGTELSALVEQLKPEIATAATTPDAIPDSSWQTEMQNFIVGRYDRVQTAAQYWLTIMTTLFGVFSTVVVVSGAKTISDIHGGLPWQIGVVAGAAAVFLLAFVATMYGLFASWGGLGADLSAAKAAASISATGTPRDPKNRVLRKLTRIWRKLIHPWSQLKKMYSPRDLELPDIEDPVWQNYRCKYTLDRANQNRRRLHRSRVLGVAAVTCTGGLALALIANGFID